MELFDTHAHLLDARFDEDREALIASLCDAGVKLVMEACTDLGYVEKLRPFLEEHPTIYGAAGLHPEELEGCTLSDLDQVAAALAHPKIKAVGEIGLDYYWPENPPRQVQRDFFDAQLSLAAAHGLPVIVHDREAHGDTVDVLRAHRGQVTGVMHCFSGSRSSAFSYSFSSTLISVSIFAYSVSVCVHSQIIQARLTASSSIIIVSPPTAIIVKIFTNFNSKYFYFATL